MIFHCASLDGQKAKVDAKKKIDIWQLPPVLVIHLKRGLAERVRCVHGCPWLIPRYQKKWCSMICHDISIYSMSNTDIMLVYDSDIFIHIPCYGNPGWIMVGTAGSIAETLHKVIVDDFGFPEVFRAKYLAELKHAKAGLRSMIAAICTADFSDKLLLWAAIQAATKISHFDIGPWDSWKSPWPKNPLSTKAWRHHTIWMFDVAWCVYVWLSCWWPQVSSSMCARATFGRSPLH